MAKPPESREDENPHKGTFTLCSSIVPGRPAFRQNGPTATDVGILPQSRETCGTFEEIKKERKRPGKTWKRGKSLVRYVPWQVEVRTGPGYFGNGEATMPRLAFVTHTIFSSPESRVRASTHSYPPTRRSYPDQPTSAWSFSNNSNKKTTIRTSATLVF